MKTLHSAARAAAMAFGKVLVMLECVVLAGLLICAQPVEEAQAQWACPLYYTPSGKAAGTGFQCIAPSSTSGYMFMSNGSSAYPSFEGFSQGGTGAVERPWQDNDREARISPQQFSSGTGFDSASIQKALDYAHSIGGGNVYVDKCGGYVLTATLTIYPNTNLLGGGFGCTVFYRSTDYGDTVVAGALGGGGTGATGSIIKGIYFYNDPAGTWTGTPKHLRVNHGVKVVVSDNYFAGLYDQLYIDGGSTVIVERNTFSPSGTVGNSSAKIVRESVDGSPPTNIVFNDNYFAAADYTYGIYAETYEVMSITNGYMGGYQTNDVKVYATYVASGLSIKGVFLDPTVSGDTIDLVPNTTFTINTQITGNAFYGFTNGTHHIVANAVGPLWAAVELNITGNTFRDSLGASLKLTGAIGTNISSNSFLNYNRANTSLVNPDYASGIFIVCAGAGGLSSHITANGNIFGSGGTFIDAANPNNYTVWGIYTAGCSGAYDLNFIGNEGTMRTGGALVYGDSTSQKTLTSSVDNMVPRTDGTTGNLQSSGITISDTNDLSIPGGGTFKIAGSGSGTLTQAVQAAAGTPTATWGTNSGTPVVTATSPLAINSTTGDITCSTCATTAGASIPAIAQGDLLYGSAANVLSALAKDTGASRFLKNSGTNNNPQWAQPAASDLSNGTTGSGAVVLATSPTLTTPTLGVAGATTINKVALTAPATGSTLTIADGKTLTASNSLTFTGTDGTSFAFPSASSTVATLAAANAFTAAQQVTVSSGNPLSLVTTSGTSMGMSMSLSKGGGGAVNDNATFGANLSDSAGTLYNAVVFQANQEDATPGTRTSRVFISTTRSGAGQTEFVLGGGLAIDGNIVPRGVGTITASVSLNAVQALPTISSCGTSPPAASNGSGNNSGEFTLGTGSPTACTVTFNTPYVNYAHCTVTPTSGYTGTYYISAHSKTAFTLTLGTGTSSASFSYACVGN